MGSRVDKEGKNQNAMLKSVYHILKLTGYWVLFQSHYRVLTQIPQKRVTSRETSSTDVILVSHQHCAKRGHDNLSPFKSHDFRLSAHPDWLRLQRKHITYANLWLSRVKWYYVITCFTDFSRVGIFQPWTNGC